MILYYLMVIVLLGIIFLTIHCACKHVELEHPMEIIIARRINRLKIMKCKRECKINELKFYKNKNNSDSVTTKIQALKLEMLLIDGEMLKLVNYGKS